MAARPSNNTSTNAPVTTINTHSTKSRVSSIRDPLCDQSQRYLTPLPMTNGGLTAVNKNANVASATTNFCGLFNPRTTQPREEVYLARTVLAVL
jgi:hypothetical protein